MFQPIILYFNGVRVFLIVGLVIASIEGVSLTKKPQTSLTEKDGTRREESPGNGAGH